MNGPIPLQDYEELHVVTKARDAGSLVPDDVAAETWARCDLIDFLIMGDSYVFLVGRRREVRPRIGRT